jgi:hypothetical protein
MLDVDLSVGDFAGQAVVALRGTLAWPTFLLSRRNWPDP